MAPSVLLTLQRHAQRGDLSSLKKLLRDSLTDPAAERQIALYLSRCLTGAVPNIRRR